MVEMDLVKNIASKLGNLVVLDLDLEKSMDKFAFNSLISGDTGNVLLVMPMDYSKQTGNRMQAGSRNHMDHPLPLTQREEEILMHLAEGQTNKMIARQLDICEGTVKVHVKNVMRKLDVRTRLEAAIWALGMAGGTLEAGELKK